MFKDFYELFKDLFNTQTFNLPNVMHIDYFDFIIKLVMSVLLMLIFRQYYSLKKQQTLNHLLNQTLIEKTFKTDEMVAKLDVYNVRKDITDRFNIKVHKAFENTMKNPEIDKMINEYLENIFPSEKIKVPLKG